MRAGVSFLSLVAVLALSACSPRSAITVSLPSRAEQGAVSTDTELCSRITPRFIMDLPEVGGDPTLDVAMEDSDTPCMWQLPKGTALKRGVYTLLIRFDAELGGTSTCAGGRVAIGAFAKEAISFPFPESFQGFADDQFKSRPGDGVPNHPEIAFDDDGDGRDSYAEVSSGTDPCAPNEPPTITFSPETPLAQLIDEGEVFWTVSSVDVDDAEHDLVLSVRHRNAGAGTPVAALRLPTNGNVPTVSPAPEDHPTEGWVLEVDTQDSDARAGAGTWRVRFFADEPFIGTLDLTFDALVDGVSIGTGEPALAQVEDVEDPTSLVVIENPTLTFPEVQPNPVLSGLAQELDALERAGTARLQVIDEDLDDDVAAFGLGVQSCPGLFTLEPDAPAFVFTWAPDNAVSVAEPTDGHVCTFALEDGAGAPAGATDLLLRVTPYVNDTPIVTPPDLAALQLPPVGFGEHSAPFVVTDPDAVLTAPTCTVAMIATGTTPCNGATVFDDVRCEALAQVGADWTFQLTLTPGATYTGCGQRPGFDAEVTIIDTPPDETTAPITLSPTECNGSAAEPPECLPAFPFRTVDLMVAATLAGGAGITTFTAGVLPLIEPTTGVGLMTVIDGSFNEHMVLVDLTGSPSIAAEVPSATAGGFEGDEITRAAADPINGRFLALVRDGNSELRALLVELGAPLSASTYTLIDPDDPTICDEPFNEAMGEPVVDPDDGTFYLPCIGRGATPPARLIRIAPDGTRTQKQVAGAQPPCSGCTNGDQFALVRSTADARKWVVFPDQAGFVLVDLATFNNATPSVVDINVGAGFNADDIFASVVDAERGYYLFAWDTGTTSMLARLDFTAATPVLDPVQHDLTDLGLGRLVLKGAGTAPPAEPDLIIWPDSSSDTRTLVDVDSWAVTDTRAYIEFPSMSYGSGLIVSPDSRYAVGLNGCLQDTDPLYNVSGGWFVPWDDTPPFFIDIGLGCSPSSEDPTSAGRYLVSVFDVSGPTTPIVVLTFPEGI